MRRNEKIVRNHVRIGVITAQSGRAEEDSSAAGGAYCEALWSAWPGRRTCIFRIYYVKRLAKAGFDAIDIEPTRISSVEDARQFLTGEGLDVDTVAPLEKVKFMSAFVHAKKPVACCAPGCCS